MSLLLNAPLIAYHIYRYKTRPQGMTGPGLYDPTNIMNSDTLSKAMKEGEIKIFDFPRQRLILCDLQVGLN